MVGMKQSMTVLGAGAWGTAIAQLLADNGYQVKIWGHEPEVVANILHRRINQRYLPDIVLHHAIEPTSDLSYAVHDATIIFQATPVAFLRSVLSAARAAVPEHAAWVSLSKGLELNTLRFSTHIIDEVLGYSPRKAVISGPNFALELAQKEFTASTLACSDGDLAGIVSNLLVNDYFRLEYSDDVIGVQVGGALKNVIALAVGIAQGLGHRINTTAYLITHGLKEIAALTVYWGGKPETMYGLAGLGDLMLTCSGQLSKNLRAGHMLAHNRSIEHLKNSFPTLPEGINTLQAVHRLLANEQLDLIICKAVYRYVFEQGLFEELLTF